MTDPAPAQLAHSLQPRHVAMISFGGIIGAGLFIGSSGAIHIGGPGVALTYAACGLLVFLIMRMLGEMAVANPGQGSFVEYSALSLGRWAGFVTGWLYWYFWVFTVGAETVAGAKLLHEIGLDLPVGIIGLGLVVVMTATNLLSVRAYGELEFWFSLVKVLAIAAYITIEIVYIEGFDFPQAAANIADRGGLFPNGFGALFGAIPVVIFSMMGSEVATIAAAESADPANNVARAAKTVAFRILAFYVLSILVIVAILPWDGIAPGLSPFKTVLDVIGIPGSSLVMSVIVITAVLSCLNSGLYITSRMLYELGRAGHAPRSLSITGENKVSRLGIVIFYVFSILIIVATVQWDTLLPGHSPFPLVLDKMHIPGGEMMMRVIVITAVLSCLNSGLYVTSRMLYELAISGDAPAVLASTNKNKVPTIGILIG